MANAKPKKIVKIELHTDAKGERKRLGGSNYDQWNDRLSDQIAAALPYAKTGFVEGATAAACGMVEINPADPIEGILIGQLITANEAALSMYRRAWQLAPEYFQARTKYLALADKAARTVAMLTERLDHHRGRGQQQIVVKHVTVNADQAVVADQVVTANPAGGRAPDKLLTAGSDTPMPLEVEPTKEPVGGGTKQK